MTPERSPLGQDLGARAFALLVLGLVLAGGALRLRAVVGPFGFGWQHIGAHYGLIARNYRELGPSATRFAQITNAEPRPPEHWVYYTHHPPGMGLTAALSTALFGDRASAIRLPTFLFSLLQIAVTGALVAAVLSRAAGVAAAAATAFLPAGAYFGTHVNELGSPVICLSLLTLWLDVRARRQRPAAPPVLAVLAALAAAFFFDFPALLVAGWIVLRDACGRRFGRAALVAATAAGLAALHVFHTAWATGSLGGGRGGSLAESFLEHGVLGVRALLEHFTAAELVAVIGKHLAILFTAPGLVLAGLGALAAAAARGPARPGREARLLLVALALFGLGYTLPFPRGVLTHEFWMLVYLPLVALLLGLLVQRALPHPGPRAAAVVLLVGLCAYGGAITWKRQSADRTGYFQELGAAIFEHTQPGAVILTSEKASAPLLYYSRRQIAGHFGDERARAFLAAERPPPLPERGWFCLVDPPVDPPGQPIAVLSALLEERYSRTDIPLPQTGATLRLYDFSRPRRRPD